MKILYTLRAEADIEALWAYLDHRSPAAARAVIIAIQTSIDRLAAFPDLSPKTDEANVRELTLARYPYKVYYQLTTEEVRILHIRDARRRPWAEKAGQK